MHVLNNSFAHSSPSQANETRSCFVSRHSDNLCIQTYNIYYTTHIVTLYIPELFSKMLSVTFCVRVSAGMPSAIQTQTAEDACVRSDTQHSVIRYALRTVGCFQATRIHNFGLGRHIAMATAAAAAEGAAAMDGNQKQSVHDTNVARALGSYSLRSAFKPANWRTLISPYHGVTRSARRTFETSIK